MPGVPGIGPKTAAELIAQFGTLEALLEGAGTIKQPKRRETIQQHAEAARLSKKLICLHYEVPLPPYTELSARSPEPQKLADFLQDMGFKSMLLRVQLKNNLPSTPAASAAAPAPDGAAAAAAPAQPAIEKQYTIVRDAQALSRWIARAQEKGQVAFDTETTSLNALQAKLVGFSLCIEPGEACYVPLAHTVGSHAPAQSNLFGGEQAATLALAPGQLDMAQALALLKPLLEDDSVVKIGHNMKYDLLVMHQHGIHIAPVEDSMLLSYALGGGRHNHGMDELAQRYLNYATISYDTVTGTGKNRLSFEQVDIEKAAEYAAEDADVTLRLFQHFRPQLAPNKLTTLYETIERPLIAVLAGMEEKGIKVDVSKLTALSADFAARMAEFERDIYQLAGMEFNVGSPKQLGEVLFDKMQLPGGKKSAKSGAYTTDSEVLESLAEQGHALPAKVLEWRQLAKLRSTYTTTLVEQADAARRVHTSYVMTGAATGRLSSTEPNLQNIPIRTEEGRKIRSAFVAEPGWKLLSADYSQIELRLLAHIADIPTLKNAFANGQDIHAITASQMFGIPVDQVNSDLRRKAKTINFGIIYGISAHGLATRLSIGRSEAGAYIERYFAQYPGIKDYMERAKAEARENGYITTLFGRRVHLPGINDKNGAMRQFSERAAINAPLQGTAADIIKRAMIAVDRAIAPLAEDVRMLLQVHDELVFEVKEGLSEKAAPLIKSAMEGAASLSVPLTVETGIGDDWGSAH
ncbi:MAG: DNA polymerase I [Proteobacteria bacterium]|nr:DNA polymerase I [Pseudomonadota bacterium]